MTRDEGFDEFFIELLPRVVRLGVRLTGSREAAEDIASEAFSRAFARWQKVGRLPYRDAWVLRVASNLAVDRARGERRHRWQPAADSGDPSDVAAVRVALTHALAALPTAQREAVVLRYLADFSEGDVAAALGVRPGTVKSHLHRAVTSLRERLGDDLEKITYGTNPL